MSPLCACQVLADIEVTQSLQAQKVKEEEEEEEEEVAHPLDQDYALLCCQLSLLDPASREYQMLLVPGSNNAGPAGTRRSPLPRGIAGIVGMAARGDTAFLPPSLAAHPKLHDRPGANSTSSASLAGGPRWRGEKEEMIIPVPQWGSPSCTQDGIMALGFSTQGGFSPAGQGQAGPHPSAPPAWHWG